jgi:DNA-directed RNA polymerase specialized sigma24 family protein
MNTTNEKTNDTNTSDTNTNDPATASPLGATAGSHAPDASNDNAAHGDIPGNDNAVHGGVPDTTELVARPEVVRYVRAMLARYGIPPQDMPDAIAEVLTDSIEAARAQRMPATLEQWKALAAKIAVCQAVDRLREAEVRDKYDAGLCDDPDAYLRPTLHWEHRDPVDTKRYLAILKDLFDSGQMPEHGAEILWGEAEDVPHEEIAAEIGVTRSVVRNRLFRMRATFRAKLGALGLLALLLFLFVLPVPVHHEEVGAPAPQTKPPEPTPPVRCVPARDAGADQPSQKSSSAVRPNCVIPD